MANIRELKKDINYLASEIVTQGYLKLTLMDQVKEEDLTPILTEAIKMRNEMIARTNHPDGKNNPKLVKKYYSKLRKDLMKNSLDLLSQIQKI